MLWTYFFSIVTFCSAIASFSPKFSFLPEKYKDYEFWPLLDPRWPEVHNRVYMYLGNVQLWTQICLAYKTYLTELFYTNACPKINQKYFNRLHTDSIFKLQPCLTCGGACWSGWYRCLNKQAKMIRKGIFSSWAVSNQVSLLWLFKAFLLVWSFNKSISRQSK